jgi:hypothetical protein
MVAHPLLNMRVRILPAVLLLICLAAGYSKNTPALGLKTYMPDFNDLRGTAKR